MAYYLTNDIYIIRNQWLLMLNLKKYKKINKNSNYNSSFNNCGHKFIILRSPIVCVNVCKIRVLINGLYLSKLSVIDIQ